MDDQTRITLSESDELLVDFIAGDLKQEKEIQHILAERFDTRGEVEAFLGRLCIYLQQL